MGAIFALAVLAGVVLIPLMVIGLVLKVILRLVLLPLLLVKWLVMGIVMLVVGPILFLVGLFVFGAIAIVFAVPLLPLLAVAAIVWVLVRSNRRPAVA